MIRLEPWTASFVYETAKPGTITETSNKEKGSFAASLPVYNYPQIFLADSSFASTKDQKQEYSIANFTSHWLKLDDTSELAKKFILSHLESLPDKTKGLEGLLTEAVSAEQIKMLQELRRGWRAEEDLELYTNILHESIIKNNIEVAKYIIDTCPKDKLKDLLNNQCTKIGENALGLAVINENLEIAKLILDVYPKNQLFLYLNSGARELESAFDFFLRYDAAEILEHTLSLLPERQENQFYKKSYFEEAINYDAVKIMRLMYQKRAQTVAQFLEEDQENRFFDLAKGKQAMKALQYLAELKPISNDFFLVRLNELLVKNTEDEFLIKILDSCDQNQLRSLFGSYLEDDNSFLVEAIESGRSSVAEALIRKCPPDLLLRLLDSKRRPGITPLLSAVSGLDFNLVKLIIESYPGNIHDLFSETTFYDGERSNVFTIMFTDGVDNVDTQILEYLLDKSPPGLLVELEEDLFVDPAPMSFLHNVLWRDDGKLLNSLIEHYPKDAIKKYLPIVIKDDSISIRALGFLLDTFRDDEDIRASLLDYLCEKLEEIYSQMLKSQASELERFHISQHDLDAIIDLAQRGLLPKEIDDPSALIKTCIINDQSRAGRAILENVLVDLVDFYPQYLEFNGDEAVLKVKEENGFWAIDNNCLALLKLLRLAVQIAVPLEFHDEAKASDFVLGLIRNKKTKISSAKWYRTMNAFSENDASSVLDTVKAIIRYYILPNYIFRLPRELRKFISADSLKELVEKLAPKVAMSLFEGRSLDEVLGLSKSWHLASRRIINNIREIQAKGSWEPLCDEFRTSNDLVVRPFLSAAELELEADNMNNCVNNYVEECIAGDIQIFSIQNEFASITNFALKPVDANSHIRDELLIRDPISGQKFEIYQHEGPDNSSPSNSAKFALKEFKKAIQSKKLAFDANKLGQSVGLEGASTAYDYIGYEAVDESNKNSKLEETISAAFDLLELAIEKSKKRLSQSQNSSTQRRIRKLLLRNYNYLKQLLASTKLFGLKTPEPLLEQLEASINAPSLDTQQLAAIGDAAQQLQGTTVQEMQTLAPSLELDKAAKFLEQAYLIKKNFLFRGPRLKAIKFKDDMQEYLNTKKALDEAARQADRVNRQKALQHSGPPLVELIDNKPKRFLNSKVEQEAVRDYFENRCFAGLIKLAA